MSKLLDLTNSSIYISMIVIGEILAAFNMPGAFLILFGLGLFIGHAIFNILSKPNFIIEKTILIILMFIASSIFLIIQFPTIYAILFVLIAIVISMLFNYVKSKFWTKNKKGAEV